MKLTEFRNLIREEVRRVLKEETTTSKLQSLDDSSKESLNISSADPVYKNATVRKKWMNKVAQGVREIGVDVIKSKWNTIFKTLENDNYHQLSLFLILSLKLNQKAVEHYELEAKRKDASNAAAIKDFLSYKF